MKVYVLSYSDHNGGIAGVYSSIEKANYAYKELMIDEMKVTVLEDYSEDDLEDIDLKCFKHPEDVKNFLDIDYLNNLSTQRVENLWTYFMEMEPCIIFEKNVDEQAVCVESAMDSSCDENEDEDEDEDEE